jgi:purine-binding chemotaxis protein CheW
MTRGIRSRARPELDEQTRELLEKRAERLRAVPPVVVDEAVTWIAEFVVGDERYALPLAALRAVVPLRRVTPVPLSKPHIIGILRFQGRIVTAVSLASLLGVKGWSQDPAVLLVVDPGWGPLTALDCEQIPKPTTVAQSVLEQARAASTSPVIEIASGADMLHYIELARLLDRRTGVRGGS